MLKAGNVAPEFTAHTWKNEPVTLSDHRGRKVWLAFFRYASCPLCNLRVNDMIKRYDELSAAGLDILCVFQSPPDNMAKYVASQEPPFPLISDPTESLYSTYQLRSSALAFGSPKNLGRLAEAAGRGFVPSVHVDGTKTRIPADFLIGEDGVMQDVFYGKVIADHIPFERVEAFVG